MNIKFYMSDVHACGHVRGEVIAREVNRSFQNTRIDCKTSVLLSDFYAANIMVFQRQEKRGMLEKMKIARDQFRIRTVYDIDDDLFSIPPQFEKPYEHYSKPETQSAITACMNAADAVTCSTVPLAATMQERFPGKSIYVTPNLIDVEFWERAYVERLSQADDEKVTIGWMASGSHLIDAPLIADALKMLMEQHKNLHLHFVGWMGFDQLPLKEFKDRITLQPWVDMAALPQVMSNFDIGIAPLVVNQFNNCKSSIKALQYWALGLPVVTSKVPAYDGLIDHGENGFYATSTEEWLMALDELINDKEGRRNMGELGRIKALAEWDVRRRIHDWMNVYEQILNG